MLHPALFFPWAYLLLLLSSVYKGAHGALLATGEGLELSTARRDDNDSTTEADYFHFVTRPDLRAPKWSIQTYDEDALAPGYWFVAPYELLGQKERGASWVGPYIYDGKGDLIWSGTTLFDSFNIFDFRPLMVGGNYMFTAIYKREDAGVIVDSSYQIRKMVRWPGGHDAANMHEFSIFDNATKVLILTREEHELSWKKSQELGYDGNCIINMNGLLELDITASPPKTLFDWSLIDHISLDEITYPTNPNVEKECQDGWDANHCNAVDRFDNGDYLISCRHTDALYKVSRETGSILWRLGGTRSDFKFVGNAKFSRQHHARVREENATHTVLSLFDNARAEGVKSATNDYTRGLVLALHDNIAEQVIEYPRPDHEYSTSRGSLEVLPNGNVFMGWTFHSRISEHTANGKLLMKAKLPPKKNTYRSYKSPWVGRPLQPPDAYSRLVKNGWPSELTTEVSVSWNGATEIVKWNIYEQNLQENKTTLVKSLPKKGFETSTELNGWVRHVIAEAIDAKGKTLGQSRVVQSIPSDRDADMFVEEQEWLAKHVSSKNVDVIEEVQEDLSASRGAMLPGNRPILVAYLFGLCTCLLACGLYWSGYCLRGKLRKRQQVQQYEAINRDDHDDDYELADGFEQVDDRTSHVSSPQGSAKGSINNNG